MSLLDSVRPAATGSVRPADTGVSPEALGRITADYARRRELWAPLLRYGTFDHWSMRVHADDDVDIWLITWLHQQSTTLHDHGSSAGAFTVVSGRLREYLAPSRGGQVCEYEFAPRKTRSFGPLHVHDVYNPYAEPAVSVHAYSPPLTEMSYYTVDAADGRLQQLATAQTVVPEGQATIMPSLTLEV